MENTLQKLRENSSFRSIKNIDKKLGKYIYIEDKPMLNLSSNDYLGLSTNKDLVLEFLDKYKNHVDFLFSSASARLLTGNTKSYFELEDIISNMFQKERALLFNTGYQCNQGVISAILNKGDCIFSDKLNHASIVSGLKLSMAEHFRYPHLDYDTLEKMLKEKRENYKNALIITESVFSMDGDIADIKRLIELKQKYNCYLMADEAHAFGVFGENLSGAFEKYHKNIDIITVTFGKALASLGAICISNNTVIDYLINKSSPFIFSTSLAPVNILWTKFLLSEKFELLREKKEKLNSLFKEVHKIYPTVSSSQIIPIIVGESEKTKQKAQLLQNKGYYVLPINPPTVPKGTSRLRISLTADMELEEIRGLFNEDTLAQ